jgi:hypothetical protein
MNKPENLYRLKAQGEAQKLIQLRDDSARPSTSVGVGFLQGFLFGAPAMQPSKAEPRSSGGKVFLLFLILVPIVVAIRVIFFR